MFSYDLLDFKQKGAMIHPNYFLKYYSLLTIFHLLISSQLPVRIVFAFRITELIFIVKFDC